MGFKVGDKVVPISKSKGCELRHSYIWEEALRKNQKYLHVVKSNEGVYSCALNEYPCAGDYFLEKDLILYKDNDNNELSELKETVSKLQSRVEQLGKLVEDNLDGSTDEVFTYEDYKNLVREAKEFVESETENAHYINGYITIVDFKVNRDKETIVALARVIGFSDVVCGRGISRCGHDDVFQEDIGKAIALGRLLGKDVSKFTNI